VEGKAFFLFSFSMAVHRHRLSYKASKSNFSQSPDHLNRSILGYLIGKTADLKPFRGTPLSLRSWTCNLYYVYRPCSIWGYTFLGAYTQVAVECGPHHHHPPHTKHHPDPKLPGEPYWPRAPLILPSKSCSVWGEGSVPQKPPVWSYAYPPGGGGGQKTRDEWSEASRDSSEAEY